MLSYVLMRVRRNRGNFNVPPTPRGWGIADQITPESALLTANPADADHQHALTAY